MKKINLIVLMVVMGISIFSMDTTPLITINVMEKEIEKNFIIGHSKILNEGKPIDCEVEVNLFEKIGLVRLIGKNIVEVNELIIKSEDGFFDECFNEIVRLVKNEMSYKNYKDYEINLIFVSEEENKLIAKRYYTI